MKREYAICAQNATTQSRGTSKHAYIKRQDGSGFKRREAYTDTPPRLKANGRGGHNSATRAVFVCNMLWLVHALCEVKSLVAQPAPV